MRLYFSLYCHDNILLYGILYRDNNYILIIRHFIPWYHTFVRPYIPW